MYGGIPLRGYRIISRAAILWESDFKSDDKSTIQEVHDTLVTLLTGIEGSQHSMSEMREVVVRLPRLSSSFNKAKKHVVESLAGLNRALASNHNLTTEAAKCKAVSIVVAVLDRWKRGRYSWKMAVTVIRTCEEDRAFYSIELVLTEWVGPRFQRRRVTVPIEDAFSKRAEQLIEQGRLSESQTQFLAGPVLDRAKSLPAILQGDRKLHKMIQHILKQ